ncbi:hypothetical protein [Liquorilactobacillus oeni]|uniref:Uncharacterized protein n=1 Tax=Liquorilactobacillus oeni DSM 19972 TaxID=1423777 RepID=A0A0R1ME55_9LACO|nr:hypothetical protein [Liquorilactobacillus oeni]KRL04148.1 hypothetical protein FD46_GL001265 [Liquorilactobacillus oeni DSM 19972]
MFKALLVMHDHNEGYYRMNKVSFENMPVSGQYIYNSDGLAYQVEEVASFAGYVSEKGATTILVVHPVDKEAPVSKLYGLDIERDLDD